MLRDDRDGGELAPPAERIGSRRWLARLSLLLIVAAVAILVVFAGLRSIGMLAIGLVSAVVSLAAAFWFLADRGLRRWLALALLILSPLAALVIFAIAGLLWVAAASAAAWLLAGVAASKALAPDPAAWRMPEHKAASKATHPFLIMNPRSGGGKVSRFDLKRKAEQLGAEVFLMSGSEPVDVADVARQAVARGADLLGVAGGDGTQALVAEVAADCGLPFMVITAGTRNHFALDLGLDRDDPAACLNALTDAVDIRVDLGVVGEKTFVNNASFGAYAEVVQSSAYRDDKVGATLNLLPDLLSGQQGTPLDMQAGEVTVKAPQAVLVANNPYGTGDIAGLSRRTRLDGGSLGVVGINVANARQAAGLLRGSHSAGLTRLTAPEVIVQADAPDIPVGIDGEALRMPTPVRCATRPGALLVRLPRDRPGVPAPRARMNLEELRHLAVPRRSDYEYLTDAAQLAGKLSQLAPKTVVFDIEPLVAVWDGSQQDLDGGVASVLDRLADIPGIAVVCFATNSDRLPSAIPDAPGLRVEYVASARKPLRKQPYRDMPQPGVVVGDQILTDGLLARRLGYTFLHVRPQFGSMPIGPRLLFGFGELVRPFLFGRPARVRRQQPNSR